VATRHRPYLIAGLLTDRPNITYQLRGTRPGSGCEPDLQHYTTNKNNDDQERRTPMKRYTLPRVAHCSDGCQTRS
jgi:hypothetical protein